MLSLQDCDMKQLLASINSTEKEVLSKDELFLVPEERDFPRVVDQSSGKNRCKLYCPNPNCRCLIAFADSAQFEIHESDFTAPPIENLTLPDNQKLFSLPQAYEFANIAFSKKVASNNGEFQVQYLSCPDCDCGPLGWAAVAPGTKEGEYKPGRCFLYISRCRHLIRKENL